MKDDEEVERALARPESSHPNYVTRRGLRLLEEQLASAESSSDTRDAVYLRHRIENAIVVDPARQPGDVVQFGATVSVEGDDGRPHAFTIVGEDEADPTHGTISWVSPLAQALLNARLDDRVVWRRPAGDAPVRITRIEYRAE